MVFIPGPVATSTCLETGVPVRLANGVAAAQSNPPVAVASNPLFSIQARGDGGDRTLNLHATGVGATPTTVTVSVYASDDGGVTFNLYQAPINLIVAGAATDFQQLHLVAGMVYQLLVTALTLGGATAVNVDGSLS